MASTKLDQLAQLSQSIWLDYVSRHLLASGQLAGYIDLGLRGLTSKM